MKTFFKTNFNFKKKKKKKNWINFPLIILLDDRFHKRWHLERRTGPTITQLNRTILKIDDSMVLQEIEERILKKKNGAWFRFKKNLLLPWSMHVNFLN